MSDADGGFPDPWEHERLVVARGRRSELTVAVAVHSTRLGPALGGVRLWTYDHWRDGIADVLRLSAAMTLKNALAGLAAGGGKSVIPLPPGTALDPSRRVAVCEDLGELVESLGGSYRAAEDVGTTAEDMAVIRTQTAHVLGLPRRAGGVGEPADATAEGVYRSVLATLGIVNGQESARDRRITIAGLGQVGSRLARKLRADGAILTVTDLDERRAELAHELGAEWVDPAIAHRVPADVFSPAGVGGALTPTVISELDCAAVVGPANNQLEHSDGDRQLAARGILYAPDFVVNAGGVIYLVLASGGAENHEIDERVSAIGSTVTRVFEIAAESGITTTAAATQLAQERLSVAPVH